MELTFRIDWSDPRSAFIFFAVTYLFNSALAMLYIVGSDRKKYASSLSVTLPTWLGGLLSLNFFRIRLRAVPLLMQLLNIALFLFARIFSLQNAQLYSGLYLSVYPVNLLAFVAEILYFRYCDRKGIHNHLPHSLKSRSTYKTDYRNISRYK